MIGSLVHSLSLSLFFLLFSSSKIFSSANTLSTFPPQSKNKARAFGCSSRDRKKLDVQTKFKKHMRKLFASRRRNQASLWHLRFGHLHHGGIKELAKKIMVHGLTNMDYEGKFL